MLSRFKTWFFVTQVGAKILCYNNLMESTEPAPSQPQTKPGPQFPSIEALPEALDFAETAELSQLHEQMTGLNADSPAFRELAGRYIQLAGDIVEQQAPGEAHARAQIALVVAMAIIRRDSGRVDYYIEELEEARWAADNEGLADIVRAIDAALAEADTPAEADLPGPANPQNP
jgi:hypothetical protein